MRNDSSPDLKMNQNRAYYPFLMEIKAKKKEMTFLDKCAPLYLILFENTQQENKTCISFL